MRVKSLYRYGDAEVLLVLVSTARLVPSYRPSPGQPAVRPRVGYQTGNAGERALLEQTGVRQGSRISANALVNVLSCIWCHDSA